MPTPNRPNLAAVIAGTRRAAIAQGDCIHAGRSIADGVVDLVLCDPPYGMSYQGFNNKQPPIANDKRPFIWWIIEAHRVCRDGGSAIVFCTWKTAPDFKRALELAGFHIASQIIWDKGRPGMGHTGATFAPRYEVAWFATKGRFRFPGGRPSDVIPMPMVPVQQREHSTQKPIDLLTHLIEHTTRPGDLVYDPTCGSGSAIVAAVECGRRGIGIELDPDNASVARRRVRAALAKSPPTSSPTPSPTSTGRIKTKLARGTRHQLARGAA